MKEIHAKEEQTRKRTDKNNSSQKETAMHKKLPGRNKNVHERTEQNTNHENRTRNFEKKNEMSEKNTEISRTNKKNTKHRILIHDASRIETDKDLACWKQKC